MRTIKQKLSHEHKTLFKNTFMLYVLTFSAYLFSFITLPYQTRVLGPEIFGIVGIAMASMMFVQLFIDFGFTLYATGKVSVLRNDKKKIDILYSSVMSVKIVLSLISLLLLCLMALFVPFVGQHFLLFLFYTLASIAYGILPDFIYRGMETMAPITVRTVITRGLFALLIFALLKDSSQYLLLPILLLTGNLLAALIALIDVPKRFDIHISKPHLKEVGVVFKEASMYFYSRIASTVYGASSTLILGATAPGVTVGFFSSADKLTSALKNAASPIADSLYPHMMSTKNFALMKKIILTSSIASALLGIVLFVYAKEIATIVFGPAFVNAAPILQALSPIIALALPYYLIGFPTMSPLGIAKHANYSIFLATICYVLIIPILLLTNHLTAITIAIVMSLCEGVSFAYRIIAIRQRLRSYKV